MPSEMVPVPANTTPLGQTQVLDGNRFGVMDPKCVVDRKQVEGYLASTRMALRHDRCSLTPVGPKTREIVRFVDEQIAKAERLVDRYLREASGCFFRMVSFGPGSDYTAVRTKIRLAIASRNDDPENPLSEAMDGFVVQAAGELPVVGTVIDWAAYLGGWLGPKNPSVIDALNEIQQYYARLKGRDQPVPTPPIAGPPSPHRVYVDREVRVDVPVPYVVRQRAAGSFALRVVNDRREAAAQAKAWSGKLRTLDAERARRLADPAATKGPGTPAWDALGQQITHARAGLANAVTALYSQAAAQAAVAESEASALPLSMAAWQRGRSTPAPAVPAPAPAAAAPADVAGSGPSAVTLGAAPRPAAEADLSAVCEAYEEGLLAALRAAR